MERNHSSVRSIFNVTITNNTPLNWNLIPILIKIVLLASNSRPIRSIFRVSFQQIFLTFDRVRSFYFLFHHDACDGAYCVQRLHCVLHQTDAWSRKDEQRQLQSTKEKKRKPHNSSVGCRMNRRIWNAHKQVSINLAEKEEASSHTYKYDIETYIARIHTATHHIT